MVISITILVTVHCLESLYELFSAQYISISVGSPGIIQKLFTLRELDVAYWLTSAQVILSRNKELEQLLKERSGRQYEMILLQNILLCCTTVTIFMHYLSRFGSNLGSGNYEGVLTQLRVTF